RRVRHEPETTFTLPQGHFGALALRDIDDRRQDGWTALCLHRAEPNLYGKLTAVLAPAKEIAHGAHRCGNRCREIKLTVYRMLNSKSIRQDHLHRLTEHFALAVAEEFLHPGVH